MAIRSMDYYSVQSFEKCASLLILIVHFRTFSIGRALSTALRSQMRIRRRKKCGILWRVPAQLRRSSKIRIFAEMHTACYLEAARE